MGTAEMNRPVTLSTWLVAMALLCSRSLLASEPNAIPQRFHARVGGFNGFTYEVQLQDGRLEYARSGGGQKSRRASVRPTMEQWRKFRRELDAIGIWRWRAQYVNPGVTDGTQWSLEVAYPDRALKTQGSNDYPGDAPNPSGVPSASKAFARYLKAVQRLVGGRAFE
jgi:hypothetical protein